MNTMNDLFTEKQVEDTVNTLLKKYIDLHMEKINESERLQDKFIESKSFPEKYEVNLQYAVSC